jgi:hypothetical protein
MTTERSGWITGSPLVIARFRTAVSPENWEPTGVEAPSSSDRRPWRSALPGGVRGVLPWRCQDIADAGLKTATPSDRRVSDEVSAAPSRLAVRTVEVARPHFIAPLDLLALGASEERRYSRAESVEPPSTMITSRTCDSSTTLPTKRVAKDVNRDKGHRFAADSRNGRQGDHQGSGTSLRDRLFE